MSTPSLTPLGLKYIKTYIKFDGLRVDGNKFQYLRKGVVVAEATMNSFWRAGDILNLEGVTAKMKVTVGHE